MKSRSILNAVILASAAFAPLSSHAAVDSVARGLAASAWRPGASQGCGTVTLSTPCLKITETWNNGSTVFGAPLTVNVTNTSSAAGSLVLDAQVGGASVVGVDVNGSVGLAGSRALIGNYKNEVTTPFAGTALYVPQLGGVGWYNQNQGGGTVDVALWRDAANTLALRNGTNAQTFNVYNTYTDASNFERGGFDWSTTANTFRVGTSAAGTGTQRDLDLVGASVRIINGATTNTWTFNGSGTILANLDNTYDIGTSGANRPRNIYVGTNITAGGYVAGTSGVYTAGTSLAYIISPGDGAQQIRRHDGTQSTVSTLPTCNAGADGAISWVTDATQTFSSANFGVTVTGGGTNHVPLRCDGVGNWKIGQATNDNLPPHADRLIQWTAFG